MKDVKGKIDLEVVAWALASAYSARQPWATSGCSATHSRIRQGRQDSYRMFAPDAAISRLLCQPFLRFRELTV
jgi:hypothetical protein